MDLRKRKTLALLCSVIIPGSGYVILGRPFRGLLMLFWMVIFGYITFSLAKPETSFIGKFSGGIAVWALSLLEISRTR